MRLKFGFLIMIPMLVALLIAGEASASFSTWSGLEPEHSSWLTAAGGSVPIENFNSYAPSSQVSNMPSVNAYFADAISPYVLGGSARGGNQIGNDQGPGRGAWSSWTIMPDSGKFIYSLGLWNSGGYPDFVEIDAYDAANSLVGFVDTAVVSGDSTGFAGFVSTTPIAKVIVFPPTGNNDGLNGFDDLQIGTNAPNGVPEPATMLLLGLGLVGLAGVRRKFKK